jgi:ubiquinone/menaquinone biosynthesis C-methylase UbiE
MSDTFESSLAHWSEAGRTEMDAFYALATADYRVLACAHDWSAWLLNAEKRAGGPLTILDVACGSGKFPTALVKHAGLGGAGLRPVSYALLDPSSFSIAEARSALETPFVASEEYECTLQDLKVEPDAFDIVWATHALYAVPPSEIDVAMERFVAVCGGQGLIAHAAERSHYIAFDKAYRAAFPEKARTPYTTAEEVVASLRRLGADVSVREVDYMTEAPAQSPSVEGFLQRCVFDDSYSLAEMEQTEALGSYLDRCRTDAGWQFPQMVNLIFLNT